MKKTLPLILVFVCLIGISSCKQIQQALQMAKCDFRMKDVTDINVVGVNVQKIESFSDISISDVLKLTGAFAKGSFPVSLKVNLEVRNPNAQTAALNRLDWILMMDQTELAQGTTSQRVEVPAGGGTAVMPISITSDLKKVLSSESMQSLVNMVLNMADASGKPTTLMLKAKPYITVGSASIAYPGYINIKTDFVSQ